MTRLHFKRDADHRPKLCRRAVWLLGLLMVNAALAAEPPQDDRATMDLTLKDFLQRVIEGNESVQARMLEVEINRRKYKVERGAFEPELVTSYERQENSRENTTEQLFGQGIGASPLFSERNNVYNAGLESLLPTGARVRLGYTLRDLQNNLQQRIGSLFTNGEYSTFFGATITQPLLKNAGLNATLANIRLAAMTSEIAFQEYRRQLMQIVATAEASYWNLYMAQQQLLFFRESVALAETILKDNQARLQAGKGSELEVLEAESGLALRKTKQAEAREKYFEALNRLAGLYAESPVSTNKTVIAVDEPELKDSAITYFNSWQEAFELNPDYQAQRKRVLSENIRLAYAKNQRWPQLDLKASYGLNGLGDSPSSSFDDIERQGFPSWSVGLELHVPLGGGVKVHNEFIAAKVRQKQALVSLKDIETQIANGLDTALHKVRRTRESVPNYRAVVNFTQNLLESRLAQLQVGKVESRKVLEVEADLFEAKNAVVDALVQYERALLELELIQGATLKNRNLDLTQRELEATTSQLANRGRLTDEEYARFLNNVQWEFQKKGPGMDAPAEERARQLLHQKTNELEGKPPPVGMSQEDYEKALRILREQTKPPVETPPSK